MQSARAAANVLVGCLITKRCGSRELGDRGCDACGETRVPRPCRELVRCAKFRHAPLEPLLLASCMLTIARRRLLFVRYIELVARNVIGSGRQLCLFLRCVAELGVERRVRQRQRVVDDDVG